jgi:hypothetical protein
MGISDEDYANALEHQRAHQVALMKLEVEKQKIGMITSTNYPANLVATTGINPYLAPSTTPSGSKVLTEADLQNDAMKAPLSALLDMWTMRWQGEWVDEADFQEDDFWRIALIRLVGANKLEKHHLASQYAAVYRVIE